MNAIYKKMIAIIKTIIASTFYRNPIKTHIKKAVRKISFANCLWAILGLNQGPPDYESVALTN